MTKREAKKILTKEEASLVKGMFQHTSLNNQQILSYFICPGYDINQRVITQIKTGILHSDVQAASKETVQSFINCKERKKEKSSIDLFIEKIHITSDEYIEEFETKLLELKKDFSSDFDHLMKPILGFSNADGGFILYGIEDTRKICGMSKKKCQNFEDFDLRDLNRQIHSFASSEIKIEKAVKKLLGKKIGILHILPSERKPVICISNGNNMVTGRIYYRYNAETTEIRPAELEKIIDERTEIKIKNNFMKLMESVLKNGLSNSLIINSQTGELEDLNGKNIVLPENVLSKINLIKEGHFTENYGAPAYTLKGEVSATVSAIQTVEVPTDYSKTHPYTMTAFSKKLTDYFKENGKIKANISNAQIKNILIELGLYKVDQYHHLENHGNSMLHNLTEEAFDKVKNFLDKQDDLITFLKSISQFKGD